MRIYDYSITHTNSVQWHSNTGSIIYRPLHMVNVLMSMIIQSWTHAIHTDYQVGCRGWRLPSSAAFNYSRHMRVTGKLISLDKRTITIYKHNRQNYTIHSY